MSSNVTSVEVTNLLSGQGNSGILRAAETSVAILCLGLLYCLICGIPSHFFCKKHRQKVLLNKFTERKLKQRSQLENKSEHSLATQKSDEVIKSPVIADEYIGGEADVLEANRHNSFCFEELVSLIHCTSSTTFFFDGKFDALLFETLDTDKSGTIDVNEFIAGRNDHRLQFTVRQAKCPALSNFFHGTEAQLRSRLRRANLIKKDKDKVIGREAWDNFAEFNRNSRLLYYKCKTLAMGKLYYGKGMEPGKRSRFPILDALAALKMPRGWLQDYKHHVFNSHPAISVFFGSSYSVFSFDQRLEVFLIDFFMCTSLTLFQVFLVETVYKFPPGSISYYLSNFWTTLLIVTIPQGYLQRLVNRIGAVLMVGDGSVRATRSCCFRYWSHFCQALAASVLVLVLFASFGVTYLVGWIVVRIVGSGIIISVVINALIGYATSLVIPLLYEYNPSSDIFQFALFLINVKKFRNHEASSAVGQKVAVFNRGSTTSWFKSERLSDLGTGLVERVHDSDEVVVLLDDPERAARHNDQILKQRRYKCCSIGCCCCCRCCCRCFFWAQKGSQIPPEKGRVILKVVSLASLDVCGKKVIIISPSQPQYDGEVATCNSFFGRRGLYEVTMASGQLCYFPPDNVRPFNESKPLSDPMQTDIDISTIEKYLGADTGDTGPDVEGANNEDSSEFDAEIAPNLSSSSDSEEASEPSWWRLLLRFDEAGLRRKARLRAANLQLGSSSLASKAFLASRVAQSRASAPDANKENFVGNLNREASDDANTTNGERTLLSKVSIKSAAAPYSRARKAAIAAVEAAAKARARAQFEAERFARSWIGITMGPLLGWFILDYLQICAWRRERAAVLEIMRDAITEYGPEHMSDPHVHAKALLAREEAARILQEGGTVRLRGPSVAESYQSSRSIRESVASSNEALGRIVPDVPRGTLGVVVRGSGRDDTFLKANGFVYRHLTRDLRVRVLFPHGQRLVPADWLDEVHESVESKTVTPIATVSNSAPSRSPIRKWKQTMATREKRRLEAANPESGAEQMDVELTDRKSSNRLGAYNAMHERPPQEFTKQAAHGYGDGARPITEFHDFTDA